MLKEKLGCRTQQEAIYSITGKTAALVPEFAVEDLPSAELQPRFLHLQRKTCLEQNILMMIMMSIVQCCGTSGSMHACHATGPGSIPSRDKFPG